MTHLDIVFDRVVVYLVPIVECSDGGVNKLHTTVHKCVGPMEGGQLFVGKAYIQEYCQELACNLLQLNPYMKQSTLKATIACWGHQSKGNIAKHATSHGLWIKMEACAVK